jgi:hypothetical protein
LVDHPHSPAPVDPEAANRLESIRDIDLGQKGHGRAIENLNVARLLADPAPDPRDHDALTPHVVSQRLHIALHGNRGRSQSARVSTTLPAASYPRA